MNFHRLEYLDLDISHHRKQKLNLTKRVKISCNREHLKNQFKHIPHTSNSQQNFIVDLLLNLRQDLEVNIKMLKELVLGLGKFFATSNINTLRRNLDYVKELLAYFNSQIKRFPSKKEIIELIRLLDIKTPNPIELEIKKPCRKFKSRNGKYQIYIERFTNTIRCHKINSQ